MSLFYIYLKLFHFKLSNYLFVVNIKNVSYLGLLT